MSKTIQLTQGQVAIVCDCHAHLTEGYKWCAHRNKDGSFYAKRTIKGGKTIFLHAVINGTAQGFLTDHINHNRLDNRCSNLRTATPRQNSQNTRKHKQTSSRFKGVTWHKENCKWKAAIGINGENRYLGCFDSEEEAAEAYNKVGKAAFGEFFNPS
jgi:hypothetical protein